MYVRMLFASVLNLGHTNNMMKHTYMRGKIGEKPAPTWREGPQIDLGIHGHYVNSSVVVEWAP